MKIGWIGSLVFIININNVNSSAVLKKDCPIPENSSLEEIITWAKNMDNLGHKYLRSPQPGEVQTEWGTVIDSSCLAGDREKKLERINGLIKVTLQKASRCRSKYSFPELSNIISTMRRTKIICSTDVGLASAVQIYSEGKKTKSARREKSYVMNLNPQILERDEAYEDATSVFFHEMLHFEQTCNRHWHNNANTTKTDICSIPNLFDDRVYFIHSACFPESIWGELFYNQMTNPDKASCANRTCENALMTNDSESIAGAKKEMESGFSYEDIYLSIPYEKNLVEDICTKVINYKK